MTPKRRRLNPSSRPGERQFEFSNNLPHQPVLIEALVQALSPAPGKIFLDASIGYAGHARQLAPPLGPDGLYLGMDCDPEAIEYSRTILESLQVPYQLAQSRFNRLAEGVNRWDPPHLDGILFDLGVSSPQIDRPERGFSFMKDGPLDMRMDPSAHLTAAILVNHLNENDLAYLLRRFGEERRAKTIAHAIVQARKEAPIETTGQLSDLIRKTLRNKKKKGVPKQIHPATKTFMALRIEVNRELEQLSEALKQAIQCLSPGGRLAVLSYHSLEDRIVKTAFRDAFGVCKCPPGLPQCACGAKPIMKPLTRHPISPSQEEIDRNPRARSARLRVAEKLPGED